MFGNVYRSACPPSMPAGRDNACDEFQALYSSSTGTGKCSEEKTLLNGVYVATMVDHCGDGTVNPNDGTRTRFLPGSDCTDCYNCASSNSHPDCGTDKTVCSTYLVVCILFFFSTMCYFVAHAFVYNSSSSTFAPSFHVPLLYNHFANLYVSISR